MYLTYNLIEISTFDHIEFARYINPLIALRYGIFRPSSSLFLLLDDLCLLQVNKQPEEVKCVRFIHMKKLQDFLHICQLID